MVCTLKSCLLSTGQNAWRNKTGQKNFWKCFILSLKMSFDSENARLIDRIQAYEIKEWSSGAMTRGLETVPTWIQPKIWAKLWNIVWNAWRTWKKDRDVTQRRRWDKSWISFCRNWSLIRICFRIFYAPCRDVLGELEMRMAVKLIIDWLNFASFNKN